MTSRQFDTTTPTATAERTPTRQTQAPGAQRNPLLPGAAPAAGGVPERAVALRQASGGRLARASAALLQLQRDHGNRYVQQVVRQARQDEAAAGAAGGELDAALRRDLDAARRGGRRLDGTVGAQLGQALSSDFRTVKVHTDARADALTRSLRASAFTVGGDIFFRKGAYAPHTSSGRELLAHELTHVVQQGCPTGTGASTGVTVGPADDRHEREADRVASNLAGQRRPRPPAPAEGRRVSAAGAAVQRRYLDQPKTGYATWQKDTTVSKGLVSVSRAKLAAVDQVLQSVLAEKAKPTWMQSGEPLLKNLETALSNTKYGQGATKTSAVFDKRRRAVLGLHDEVQKALSTVMLSKIIAAGGNSPATPAVATPVATPVVPTPVVATPDPAAELQKVGFLPSFLTSMTTNDLDLLFEAHEALGAKDFKRAQAVFDILNPPVKATGPTALPGYWEQEAFESIKLLPSPLFDFKRTSDALLAAQRQLIVYHSAAIGGDYGKLLSYKPYKAQALTPMEVQAGKKYFDSSELRDWDTIIELGDQGKAPLIDALAEAQPIVDAATQASLLKGKTKGPKQALTDEEVTAIRIYTADEYREMNAVFRDFRVDKPTENWEKYSAIARLAISGLGKLPKAKNTTSYRGDNDISFGGHAGVLQFGATFRLPNFYSTTMQPASAFSGQLGYVFHNKSAGRVIEKFSAYKGEAEILIPPGAIFEITGEFHLQSGTWVKHDGTPGLSRAAEAFLKADKHHASRKTILEFTEKPRKT
jgi:hypothetical protein